MARGFKHRLHQTIIAFDQFLNAALLNGWADETISARAYRRQDHCKKWKKARIFIDMLFFFENEHCKNSHYNEKMREHMPPCARDDDPRIQ